MTTPYDNIFFRSMDDWALSSARVVVPELIQILQPKSILDVGSGTGGWGAEFGRCGIDDYLCIDGDYVDRKSLRVPSDRFQAVDLEKHFDLRRRFDLVVCLEVAEHLQSAVADTLIASLTAHADVIVFSAAIPLQGGTYHVNEQWPAYWAQRFRARSYRCFDLFRWRLWSKTEVAAWYKQNMLLFINEQSLSRFVNTPDLLKSETDEPPAVVHPETYTSVAGTFRNLQALEYVPRLPWAARALLQSARASVRHHVSKILRK